jgi:hypothetical protein
VDEVVCHGGVGARGVFDLDGKRETVRDAKAVAGEFEGWVLVHRHGTLTLPVEVELRLADGTRERVSWDGLGDSVRLAYHGKTALIGAVVDPDHRVLLDDNLTNNHAVEATSPSPEGSRVLDRAAYWAGLFVSAVTP